MSFVLVNKTVSLALEKDIEALIHFIKVGVNNVWQVNHSKKISLNSKFLQTFFWAKGGENGFVTIPESFYLI